MTHYATLVEDAGHDRAVGVWFPDLPGCFSAGDNIEEALKNAEETISLYAESLGQDGRSLPPPRSLSALKEDPEFVLDAQENMIALVAAPESAATAAE